MSALRRSLPSVGRLAAVLAPLSLWSISCGGTAPEQNPPQQAPEAVTGQRAIYRRLDTGDVRTVDEAGLSALSVLVPVGGSFETRSVVATGGGTFKFENIPLGPYYLKYGETEYILTEHRELDLDEYILGREGVATTNARVLVSLSVDGLESQTQSELWGFGLVTPNAGAAGAISLDSAVAPGVDAISQATGRYQSHVGLHELIDAAWGDRAYLLQSLQHVSNGFDYGSIARAGMLSDVTFHPEDAVRVSSTLSPVPQQQATIDWRRSSFGAFQAAVHPLAKESAVQFLDIMPAAGGLSKGWVGYSGELLAGSIPASGQDVSLQVEYGNPYPSTWGVVARVLHPYWVPVLLPGTTEGGVSASLAEQAEVGRFLSGPVQARVSPPANLQVDGAHAWEDRDLASLTPVLTWEPPALGTPDVYEVRILRLYTRPNAPTYTASQQVANIFTKARRLQVPPGVLQPGQTYVVRIAAKVTPGVDLTRSPYGSNRLADYSSAAALTSLLRAP